MTNPPIRILLVDDHSVVIEGLRSLLEQYEDVVIVGEACDGQVALAEVERLGPDVVLLDMKMPGMSGIDTIVALKQRMPSVAVLVFTSFAEESQVRDAINAGALGYLLKDALREDLIRAVRAVAAGQAWLHPQAQRQVLDWLRRPPSPIDQLTGRERDVLVLLAQGLSNKHIARRLDLSEGTIKGYVSQVLDKLQVNDRTQAALLAHKAGLGDANGG
ncbi:MAG: response regulator transcription factor [Arenimonas sp.]|jgi:DNA-binding NarL/FixJ family response regulator